MERKEERKIKRPNILLITTDQQRYDTIAAMGYDFMVTPNLDQLAAEGCCYPNAYSSNPVCMAARHNIITGLTARYHGFDDNYFEEDPRVIPYHLPTLPQLLSDDGYDAIAIGKMHFQPCRRYNGFTKMELMEEIPRNLEDDEYAMYLRNHGLGNIQSIHGVRHLLYMLPQRSLIGEEHHGSSWVAERTIHHLKENGGRRPFFLWSSFIAPHPPFDVPEAWADLYKDKELPELKHSETPISRLAENKKWIADYPDDTYLRRARELYCASISFVDYNIGRILQQLKDMGEYDNTLILFTSDHGEMLGDYGTFQKMLPYDSSARIPFLVRYPKKLKPGTEDCRFVDLNDILPTCLDLAGIAYPLSDRLPGESIFRANGTKDRSVQYVENGHGSSRWISLRNQRYKYTYYYGGGKEELFDMLQDPDETRNLLYRNPASEALKATAELKARLVEIEKRHGLEGYVEDNHFVVLEQPASVFYRENNPPVFPGKQERDYISLEEEVRQAVGQEASVHLDQLDIGYYEERNTLKREALLPVATGHMQ